MDRSVCQDWAVIVARWAIRGETVDADLVATAVAVATRAAEGTLSARREVTMNIKDKVAIVTGAGSGIGAAVCRELANRGAQAVVLVDRRDNVYDLADSIDTTCRPAGGRSPRSATRPTTRFAPRCTTR